MQPQVILITGASSGFGKITAQMLSAQGHIVYGTSRKLSEDMNEVKMLVVDVTNSLSIRQAVDRILSEQGPTFVRKGGFVRSTILQIAAANFRGWHPLRSSFSMISNDFRKLSP